MSVMEQITLKNSVLVVKKQHDFVAGNVPNRMRSSKKQKVKDTRKIVYLNSRTRKMAAGISFFMVSSSDLKYKLMRHVTFNPLLFWIAPGLISCIFI